MNKNIALVLGGGGARAAYQVGVLKAIVEDYPRNHNIPFDILSGSSAGAINATSLATHASCFHLGVKKLSYVWGHFTTNKVYRSSFSSVFAHFAKILLKSLQAAPINPEPSSLLNNEPLRLLLNEVMDFKRVDRNIDRGALEALSIDVSCYNDFRSYSFFQANSSIDNWIRARRVGKRTQLYTEHLLASSAIPLVFPSVKINQQFYGDGSIHQISPLSSPIHLGADKIMIINLAFSSKEKANSLTDHPRVSSIAGHLLDTIFSDTLNSDLERIKHINQTIKLIADDKKAQYPSKPIETMVITPSQDLSDIAIKHYHRMPLAIRLMLRAFGINKYSQSSIISYLLFEREYTRELMNLGYQDGKAQINQIKVFLNKSQ
ncbi:patatin-like phospholipase family protein [Parashewanella curva]|uniref:Patatin-like phospholipase family protein n=1 Tax=Parashewanella curva TaxID=2338552 RepID=A0A3L8PVD3_9GAMM|nr:patatin-like phospholipase family protein [Parashewanella curva]RLV58729.1 patatin-like phospholipase family protein [Parashewanella curva]